MKNRRIGLMLVLAAVFFAGCIHRVSQPSAKVRPVIHMVLVWLKDAGNDEHRTKTIQAAHSLEKIPGMLSLSVGKVLPSERATVDDSFDVGLVMRFESAAALEAYQIHPDHLKAVHETLRPLAKKFVIYDVTEE